MQKYLTHYDSIALKFYGLPKLHKADVPLRPITSFVKAPTYYLSRFLGTIATYRKTKDKKDTGFLVSTLKRQTNNFQTWKKKHSR